MKLHKVINEAKLILIGIPVFLYEEAARDESRRHLEDIRRGGFERLAGRMADGRWRPDFGPAEPHPAAGATLVAARPPLVAFNLNLRKPATLSDARRIAALIREGGSEGLAGVRAIAVQLSDGSAQVSMNVERPHEVPLALTVRAVVAHAAVASGEVVGLVPAAALEDFPADVPLIGFEPARQVLEKALRC